MYGWSMPGFNIRLYIAGSVYNTGGSIAYNCKLHVIAYRENEIVIDTFIILGTIDAGSSVTVSQNISYLGGSLTDWKIIPECTIAP